ncbi:MAG: thioesterase domain-containing protein [Cephaloticoccus sp.]|nr:thioesterase domain-containing protein [Cephaloticoccus sp.]MCF7761053.1 thioesterase domain-containing protein [Cephaloticoccus sp.]
MPRTLKEIEAYLHAHIPIASAMEVQVVACGEKGVTLTAPLAANVNHRATVFGGSASAVAILAAWTWMHFSLRDADMNCRIVIQRNQMEYLLPIDGDFSVQCDGLSGPNFGKAVRTLRRYGKARATLTAKLLLKDKIVARFSGDYVAVLLA